MPKMYPKLINRTTQRHIPKRYKAKYKVSLRKRIEGDDDDDDDSSSSSSSSSNNNNNSNL
jgi:hypothetical protein